ncbi:hypothetical protein Xmau_01056 [Xenorhabdus mauleonii]|uniref:Glyoxalase/fosfomycin resistance/dioxygenase domain-containing protein n=1 Tax=Xenorhabdus mauleonii TaxID=351675 RepID=A0A1I3M5F1_9GAMM|nr:VOC family protein [Xenorhabdus mauleonii]PHM45406.1 hypothetical protein Xmau_01056 [Xenorhabdus mauleonii]SFI92241.1 hypothetical protein SAMN05421680_104173 [Xenorhabdus mauleonii]
MKGHVAGIDVLFVAGFGPITRNTEISKSFYVDLLGLPLQSMDGNNDYLLTEQDGLVGVKHFALWPLTQAAYSCFGTEHWPSVLAEPQAWLEFEVSDIDAATNALTAKDYRVLVAKRKEPWGQIVTRLLSPEGILTAVTITPWLHEHAN